MGAGLEPEPVVSQSLRLSVEHLAMRFHPPCLDRTSAEIDPLDEVAYWHEVVTFR
jgi:hypothetical protein